MSRYSDIIAALGTVLIILNFLDIVTTQVGLSLTECVVELNPYANPKDMIYVIVKGALPMVFILVALITDWMAEKHNCTKIQKAIMWIMIFLIVFYTYVVINNIWVINYALSH